MGRSEATECAHFASSVANLPSIVEPQSSAALSFRERHSPDTSRPCSSRVSSAMLVHDRRTSSAKGAFGRNERRDNAGIRPVTAASR